MKLNVLTVNTTKFSFFQHQLTVVYCKLIFIMYRQSALVGLMVLAVKVNVNVKKDILLAAIRKTEFVNVDQATLDQHAHQVIDLHNLLFY